LGGATCGRAGVVDALSARVAKRVSCPKGKGIPNDASGDLWLNNASVVFA